MPGYRTAMIGLALLAAPLPASHAQDFHVDGWGWSIIIPSVTQTDIIGLHLRELRRQDEARAAARAGHAGATPANPAPLRYTPSKQRRAANLAGFLARSKARDPAGAASLEALFAQGDLIARIAPVIGTYGLRIDDVADAYAVWWISAWAAAHGRSDTFDKATYQAVRAQAARALSAAPELAGANDSARQQLAEALLVQSTLLDGAMEQAKGDPAKLPAVAKAAAQGGRGMGLDLMAMDLTPSGFVAAQR